MDLGLLANEMACHSTPLLPLALIARSAKPRQPDGARVKHRQIGTTEIVLRTIDLDPSNFPFSLPFPRIYPF